MLTDLEPSEVPAVLDNVLDQQLAARNGRLRSREAALCGSHHGRRQRLEFDATDTSEEPVVVLEVWQAYLVQDSIVTLQAIMEEGAYDKDPQGFESRLNRFFGSLRLE